MKATGAEFKWDSFKSQTESLGAYVWRLFHFAWPGMEEKSPIYAFEIRKNAVKSQCTWDTKYETACTKLQSLTYEVERPNGDERGDERSVLQNKLNHKFIDNKQNSVKTLNLAKRSNGSHMRTCYK